MVGGHCCTKLAYLSFCLFCFSVVVCFLAFSFSFFWADGAQYVRELKSQTTMSTTYELTRGEVGYSSRSEYDHTSKKPWCLASHVMIDALELPTSYIHGHLSALAQMSGWVVGVGRAHSQSSPSPPQEHAILVCLRR